MMFRRLAQAAALAGVLVAGLAAGHGTAGATQMAGSPHRAPPATVTAGHGLSQDSSGQPFAGTETTAAVALPAVSGATLAVRTVPVIEGVRVILDGTSYATNARGLVMIPTSPGGHRIHILPPRLRHEDVRVRFARWLDGIALADRTITVSPRSTILEAGFVVSHPITVRFTDEHSDPVPPGQITQVTMASSVGQRFTFSPADPPQSLDVNRITRDQRGLHALAIRYSVHEVLIHSSNVVYGGSQNFYLHSHERTWVIKVLLFPLRIEVRDALFGFPIGSAVQLTLPDHSHRLVTLGAGHSVALTRLPRATYQIVAKGFGFGLAAPTNLSKPQVAKVLLLSWMDLAAVLAFAMLFVVGLPLVGGRIVRRSGGIRLPVWHGGNPAEAPPAESQDHVIGTSAQDPEPAAQDPEPAAQDPEPAAQDPEPADPASAIAGSGAGQAAEGAAETSPTGAESAASESAALRTVQHGAEPEDPDSTVVFPAITDVADAPASDQSPADENGDLAATSVDTSVGTGDGDGQPTSGGNHDRAMPPTIA